MTYTLDNHKDVLPILRKLDPPIHHATVKRIEHGKPINEGTVNRIRDGIDKYNHEHASGTEFKKLEPHFTAAQIDSGGGALKRMESPLREMGATAIFCGATDNEHRNKAKADALKLASGHVVLLAQTGTCFLTAGGNLTQDVRDFLRRSSQNKFSVVLVNPYSDSAIKLYLSCIEAAQSANVQPVAAINAHLSKLKQALFGYMDGLRVPGQTSLRFTMFDPICTVLSTPTTCFVEPYFQFDPILRLRKHLDSFEIQFHLDNGSKFGHRFRPSQAAARCHSDDHVQSHIQFYLDRSESLPDFFRNIKVWWESFRDKISFMIRIKLLKQEEAGVLMGELKKLGPLLEALK